MASGKPVTDQTLWDVGNRLDLRELRLSFLTYRSLSKVVAAAVLVLAGPIVAFADPPHAMGTYGSRPGQYRHVTLVLVGDTGFSPNNAQPDPAGVRKHGRFLTFDEASQEIAPQINGDINFANIETVVSARTDLKAVAKAYNFVTHPDAMRSLVKRGFNLFSTANNHAFDFGKPGIVETLDNLQMLGKSARFAGTGLTREEAAASVELKVAGASLRFSAIGIGSGPAGDNSPGQLSIHLKENQDLLISRSLDKAADYHMVSVHSGEERNPNPTAFQIRFLRDKLALEAGFDLVIGHHAHVAQPVVMADNRLVFFGLGNFLHHGTANMNATGKCRDWSILARIHLVGKAGERLTLAAVEIVPINNTHMQTQQMEPEAAATRIAVLNGLSARLDDPTRKTRGLRFKPRRDGTGIWCSPAGRADDRLSRSLCNGEIDEPEEAKPAFPDCGVSPKLRKPDEESPKRKDGKKAGKNKASIQPFWNQQSQKARELRQRVLNPDRQSGR